MSSGDAVMAPNNPEGVWRTDCLAVVWRAMMWQNPPQSGGWLLGATDDIDAHLHCCPILQRAARFPLGNEIHGSSW